MSKKEFVKPRYDCNHHCIGEEALRSVSTAINTLLIYHKHCVNDKTGRVMIWIDNNPFIAVKRIILEGGKS